MALDDPDAVGLKRLVRLQSVGTHRPLRIGLARLKQGERSRIIGAFETHRRGSISDASIPGMVAPMVDRRVLRA